MESNYVSSRPQELDTDRRCYLLKLCLLLVSMCCNKVGIILTVAIISDKRHIHCFHCGWQIPTVSVWGKELFILTHQGKVKTLLIPSVCHLFNNKVGIKFHGTNEMFTENQQSLYLSYSESYVYL